MKPVDIPNKVIVVAALVTALGVLGAVLGVDWPLTERSEIIQQGVQFDEIQELEVMKLNAEIKKINMDTLRNAIDGNRFILTQFDRPNLSPGDIREKVRLEGEIERFQMELEEWSKK